MAVRQDAMEQLNGAVYRVEEALQRLKGEATELAVLAKYDLKDFEAEDAIRVYREVRKTIPRNFMLSMLQAAIIEKEVEVYIAISLNDEIVEVPFEYGDMFCLGEETDLLYANPQNEQKLIEAMRKRLAEYDMAKKKPEEPYLASLRLDVQFITRERT